jgi:hypothetical protein
VYLHEGSEQTIEPDPSSMMYMSAGLSDFEDLPGKQ